MTNIVNSTLPTQNNHSEKNKPDGVFVIKQGKTCLLYTSDAADE